MLATRLNQLFALLLRGREAGLADRLRRVWRSESLPLFSSRLRVALAATRRYAVVLDGSHGGGAAEAAQRCISALLAEGFSVLVLRSGMVTRRVQAHWHSPGCESLIGSLGRWPVLPSAGLAEIRVECLEGYADPAGLAQWIAELHARSAASLTVAWHDHYLACPSAHLLNAKGQWCELPADDICVRCLPDNRHCRDIALRQTTIADWRHSWCDLLGAADEITVFSEHSRSIVETTYGADIAAQVRLRPHTLSDTSLTRIPVRDLGGPLHVGVVGRIAYHKGAQVLVDLAEAMRAAGARERLTVFGTCDLPLPGLAEVRGPFQPGQLQSLVVDAGVDVMLVPSIWPETFSFVTHECLRLGLPVVGFDIGAQGEALRTAEVGVVAPLGQTGDELLAVLRLAAGHL